MLEYLNSDLKELLARETKASNKGKREKLMSGIPAQILSRMWG